MRYTDRQYCSKYFFVCCYLLSTIYAVHFNNSSNFFSTQNQEILAYRLHFGSHKKCSLWIKIQSRFFHRKIAHAKARILLENRLRKVADKKKLFVLSHKKPLMGQEFQCNHKSSRGWIFHLNKFMFISILHSATIIKHEMWSLWFMMQLFDINFQHLHLMSGNCCSLFHSLSHTQLGV